VLPEPEAIVVVAEPVPVLTLVPSSVSEQPVVAARICQCKSDPKGLERLRQMEFRFERTMTVCECERIEAGCEVQTSELKASITQLYRVEMVGLHFMERRYGRTWEQQDVVLGMLALRRRQEGRFESGGRDNFDKHRPVGVVKRVQRDWRIQASHIAFTRQTLPAYLRYKAFVPSRFA
jgi:hypothetical protein